MSKDNNPSPKQAYTQYRIREYTQWPSVIVKILIKVYSTWRLGYLYREMVAISLFLSSIHGTTNENISCLKYNEDAVLKNYC
jgi:hypothetical protein